MEIKRRRKKKPKRLSPYEQSVKKLKRDLKRAEAAAITSEDRQLLKAGDRAIEAHINQKQFLARTKVVKKYRADALKLVGHIYEHHDREINWSKEKRYPLEWQANDKKIALVFDERPIIPATLNYLFNYNRWGKGKRGKMQELIAAAMGQPAYDSAYYCEAKQPPLYAAFKADAGFWAAATATLGYSESRLKAVLNELLQIGVVRKIGSIPTGDRGRPPGVYADGYFAEVGDRLVKHPFLKNNQQFRDGLRGLTKKIA